MLNIVSAGVYDKTYHVYFSTMSYKHLLMNLGGTVLLILKSRDTNINFHLNLLVELCLFKTKLYHTIGKLFSQSLLVLADKPRL